MDEHGVNPAEDEHFMEAPETPEDVAVLYTWANVHGGKYRDFSASRREYKAQQRHRMAEEQRQAELEAARAREEAAARELDEARRNEAEAAHDEELRMLAEDARRRAEEHAERERIEAQRHVETAETLKRAMEQAQREMEEARQRVAEQEARYAEADARYRASGRQQLPGEIDDPYYFAGHLEPGAFAPGRGVRSSVPQRVSSERRIAETYYKSKGSAEMPVAQERDPHGLFSSGVRRRASGSRSPYTESDSRPTFEPALTETPEDTRERYRPDEQERLFRRQAPELNGGLEDDDGYYDHRMDRKPSSPTRSIAPSIAPRNPADLNSAPSDVYIAPRTPQGRPPASPISEERKVTRSEDPSPGNTHVLDNSRIRRRDSVTDAAARTARHSRQERGPSPVPEAPAETRPDISSSVTPPYSPESYDAMRRLPADRRWLDSAATAARRLESVVNTPSRQSGASAVPNPTEERPEWLVRETPASPSSEERPRAKQVDEQSGARPSRPYDERNVRSREEQSGRPSGRSSQFVPAPDGGFNLAPLSDTPSAPRAEARPRAESGPRGLSAYPASEQRRVERASGAGDGITREIRVAPPTPPPAPPPERKPVAADPVPPPRPSSAAPPSDTLQQSRERVAARWFALKGLVGSGPEAPAEAPPAARPREAQVPTLCVLSLSGGVGKTSMVATIGRTLSAMGERVLLADGTPHGLLPYYFGAHELRPDVVRTFSPPPESKDAPVFMVNYEAERLARDEAGQSALLEEMARHAHGTQRVLMDLNNSSAWLGRRLAQMHAKILVPVTPDMNSVLGIRAVERFFAGSQDAEGRPVRPYYVLNQFDASLPLHLDVREVLRQQLGDRLLPVMIRRSPAVAEALAEGMTVMDYAPESPIAEDYTHLAEWVRNLAAPAQSSMRAIRWSER